MGRILLEADQGKIEDPLRWLIERAEALGLLSCAVQLFEKMVQSQLRAFEPYGLNRPGSEESEPQIRFELNMLASESTIESAWSKQIRPHLHTIAADVFAVTKNALANRHAKRALLRSAGVYAGTDSWGRSAIEPHQQDEHPDNVDVVVDAARDSFEALASLHPAAFAWWRSELLRSDVALLRRLALHALRLSLDITADQKIDEILASDIFDLVVRHEIFQLLRTVYPQANEATRRRLLTLPARS